MEPTGHWRAWGRYCAAAAVAGSISWCAFVADRPVPGLDWIDLGIHELGHMVTIWLPRLLYFMAGSFFQIAAPAALAVYFHLRQHDPAGTGFCMAWAGTSAWDVSVYIADAPTQALPLVGGGTHDWGYILGPQQLDAIDQAGSIAGFVETIGLIAAASGIVIASWPALGWAVGKLRVGKAGGLEPFPPEGEVEPDPTPHRHPPPAAPASASPAGAADPWLAAAQLPFYHGDGEATGR